MPRETRFVGICSGWAKLSSQGCVIRGIKYKRFIPDNGQAYGRSSDEAAVKAWALSSAEVVNEYELYLLSPQATPWRVEGLLYFTLLS
jgi:hypothetical protein